MKIAPNRPLTIRKDRQQAVIFLENYRIIGTVHLPPGGRVSDFINWNLKEGPFIPLTDAAVYDVDGGKRLFSTAFLAVHRNHIRFMTLDPALAGEKPART